MVHNELDKLMRNPHFISVTTSEDGLAWVATMNSLRAGGKWVDADGEYTPEDQYEVYIYKGAHKTPVITDPRLDYLKPDDFSPGLAHCYIVDIDGTVALIDGRSPYDGGKAHTDKVNTPMARLLNYFMNGLKHHHIVYSTGRDERFRDITLSWLQANNLWWEGKTTLLMRPLNEKKPDADVKKDNFNARVRGNYNVELVIEDRARVTKMYRDDLRLPTIEPWYSNF